MSLIRKNVFGLVLGITRECNLHCEYCYAGNHSKVVMPENIGKKAIDRALASISDGGVLELGFFGGEPLLEAKLIDTFLLYAREKAKLRSIVVKPDLTTNGTVNSDEAWSVMTNPSIELAISCDGLPEIHDRYRRNGQGGSSKQVLATMRRLLAVNRKFKVVMVVRPDTLEALPAGIEFLRDLGVREIIPSLDLWADWNDDDISLLESVVHRCAELWRDNLPELSISWFDDKAGLLTGIARPECARCGFGDGELAVAPSGLLYPCERLIGNDSPDNPMAFEAGIEDGDDFLNIGQVPARSQELCGQCRMQEECNTTCRCSNYVRTGDVTRPDRLLCVWNRACLNATAEILKNSMTSDQLNN